MFEGQFLNGERNGYGIEYNYINGELVYEGEYLNGERVESKKLDLNDDDNFIFKDENFKYFL